MYNLPHWNGGYFKINQSGNLCACHRDLGAESGVDMLEIVRQLQEQGLQYPLLIRFQHILRDRLDRMFSAMHNAATTHAYEGSYRAVYPIKVNQQRTVVETLNRHGGQSFGLEAGSKPELTVVLALTDPGEGLVICNGYKDRDYIRLALTGTLLGIEVYIIIEKYSELLMVLKESAAMGVTPRLGLRVRLSSIGKGKWQNTGGENSKFGLSSTEVLKAVELLRNNQELDTVQLLHFHIGSQIADIHDIDNGLLEAARYYQELRELGAGIHTIDVGGGLGVDYEGTGSTSFCSMNYSLEDYANSLVGVIGNYCNSNNLPHPGLITEAGRAMTAHHAVLLTDVIDVEQPPAATAGQQLVSSDHAVLEGLRGLSETRCIQNADAHYSAADSCLRILQSLYTQGEISLAEHAEAEQIYYRICRRLLESETGAPGVTLRDQLYHKLASKYFCNFSLFQSLPDIWAFQQIFPIMPIHRLMEEPAEHTRLQDLTCDSDGQISAYVTDKGIQTTLPVHSVRADEPYILGIFLVGAYQEILGDMHNLFGDTHSVNVDLSRPGDYSIDTPEPGDTVDELLRYVHFDTDALKAHYRRKIERAKLDPDMQSVCEQEIEKSFSAYSYHENSRISD